MHQLVKDYLEKQEEARKTKRLEEKDKLIEKLGFNEKEYSPDGVRTPEYTLSEWDAQSKAFKYYRIKPIEVSDEDYEAILKCQAKEPEIIDTVMPAIAEKINRISALLEKRSRRSAAPEKNVSATIIKVLSWILFIGGLVSGIILWTQFSFIFGLAGFVGGFVTGIVLLGYANIIQFLSDISCK